LFPLYPMCAVTPPVLPEIQQMPATLLARSHHSATDKVIFSGHAWNCFSRIFNHLTKPQVGV